MAMQQTVLIFGLILFNVAYGDVSPELLKCKVDVSTTAWLKISDIAKQLASKAESVLKILLNTAHDELKGSADIINALPAFSTLSPEARFQLDRNCVNAPIGIQNLLSTLATQFPDFTANHKAEIGQIRDILTNTQAAMAKCT